MIVALTRLSCESFQHVQSGNDDREQSSQHAAFRDVGYSSEGNPFPIEPRHEGGCLWCASLCVAFMYLANETSPNVNTVQQRGSRERHSAARYVMISDEAMNLLEPPHLSSS